MINETLNISNFLFLSLVSLKKNWIIIYTYAAFNLQTSFQFYLLLSHCVDIVATLYVSHA